MVARTKVLHGKVIRWIQDDPILLKDEVGVEVETGLQKIGDGCTRWSKLPYFIPTPPRGVEVVAKENIPENSMVTVDGYVAHTAVMAHVGAVLGYTDKK
jgi:hypothetical protein